MRKMKPPELSLAVQYACATESPPTRAQVRRWALATLRMPVQATIRFVDDEEGRELNRTYRGKDKATNVLTFVYATDPVVAGDLVICLPVVRREAHEQDKAFKAHLAHMVVHGMLHLQGYDHETGAADAAIMEALERTILARFKIADPYA